MFESIRAVTDQDLLASTDSIVVQDRKLTLRLLVHLHEVERRKLYLVRGYSSMFVFCTSHLRLSEPAAARRIRSARCLARFPGLYGLLESGEVNLSTVSMVSGLLTPDNAEAILARIRGKSRREVEHVVAELEPRAALPPDRVRVIVVPTTPLPQAAAPQFAAPQFTVAGDSENSPRLDNDPGEGHRAGDQEISIGTAFSSPKLERRALVQFAAREDVVNKLDRVRSLASHRLRGDVALEAIIELLVDYFIEHEDPAVRHERRKQRARRALAPVSRSSARSIPADVRDRVFVRDNGQCTYVAADGRRCESTTVLQVDHVRPVARGGAATVDNVRLLCANHNRLEAERLMGRAGPKPS